jgi:GNAT superfamily N-acetyltransferase
MSRKIFLAKDDEQIRSCYAVMAELRPHVAADEFVIRVKRQHEIAGYEIAAIADEAGEVKAVAGFRISECLAWGKFLYVDDLVSKSDDRSKGFGGDLFDWVVDYAKQNDCDQFHLDSGVHRFAAHRFYLVKRMSIEGHHFGMKLKD